MSTIAPTFKDLYDFAIAINIGATTCSAAVFDPFTQSAQVIPNDLGYSSTPSYIYFKPTASQGSDAEDSVLIGEYAKYHASCSQSDAKHLVQCGFTRMLGKRFSDSQVQDSLKRFSCNIISENNIPVVVIHNTSSAASGASSGMDDIVHRYTFEELLAMMMKKLRESAEKYLGKQVNKAVITISTQCTAAARQAIASAASSINLTVLRVVNQASAAAIAYQSMLKDEHKRLVKEDAEITALVFALSGGCLTTSVCNIDKDMIEVKSSVMNEQVGGADLDEAIIASIVAEIKSSLNVDVSNMRSVMTQIRIESENAKRYLSTAETARVTVHVPVDKQTTKCFHKMITREQFIDANEEKFKAMEKTVQRVLAEAKMSPSDINDVVMVGNSCQIPNVEALVKGMFASVKTNQVLLPEQVVVRGAAMLAALLSGQVLNLLLVDTTPLSLGIETIGGAMTVIVPHNSTMPCKKTVHFTTTVDNQKVAQIRVLEGESLNANKDNTELIVLQLNNLQTPSKAGEVVIHVTFSVRANGNFHVVVEEASNLSNRIEADVQQEKYKYSQVQPLENAALRLKVEFV